MNNMPNLNIPPLMQPAPTPRYSQQQIPDNYTYPQSFQHQILENSMSQQYAIPEINSIDSAVNNYESMPNAMSIPGLLERYIGKIMKVEFLLCDALDDKLGRLLSVGNNYIVLGMLESKVIMICNTDTLKFVTVILDEENNEIAF